jgi:uncharacterized protein (UPF0147 family)
MEMDDISRLLEEINNDRSVPKNIRTLVSDAKSNLGNPKLEKAVKINAAISILDEVSNDPNIPTYTRTQIWNIVSLLEVANEEK